MGDPVCWMASTCPDCGRFLTPEEMAGLSCPRCGVALRAAPAPDGEGPAAPADRDDG